MASIGTKPPTGLTITRKNGVFTFSWKNGDSDYKSGINIWALYGNKITLYKGPCNVDATSKSCSINLKKKFKKVQVNVQGKRSPFTSDGVDYYPMMSGWSWKNVTIKKPPIPSGSFSLDSKKVNQGKFTWSVPSAYKETNMAIFEHYEWQSIVVEKHNSYNPPKRWKKPAKGHGTATSTSKTFVEESGRFLKKDYSFTRWFRVRSVGPAGASGWRYLYHVYAIPRPASISATSFVKELGGGYLCKVKWTAPNSPLYPVDLVEVEYAIGVPVSSTSTTSGTKKTKLVPPDNLSWKNAGAIKDTTGADGLTFRIDNVLTKDQCVFIRVLSTHDRNTVSSKIVMAPLTYSFLGEVEAPSITPEISTHRVTIEADNPSDISDAFIAVHYRTSDMDEGTYKTIGIIPKGASSATIQCPDWGTNDVSFGLEAFVANYSPTTLDYTHETEYRISGVKMRSTSIAWSDSSLPKAPQSVVLSSTKANTITVMWDWAWAEANQAELSWSQDKDAWTSTDQPSNYIVNSIYNSVWNISGLSVGTWYVRVRLNKITENSEIFGMWSEVQDYKLSSAPAIPDLTLKPDGVIAPDGELTCYWAYSCDDGTAQVGADICEAFLNSETNLYTYGEPFGHANTSTQYTFLVKDRGWTSGDPPHYLAVRVTSASGETSADWSPPKAISIADPPTCSITDSSFVALSTDTGGYESAYDPKYEPTADAPITALVPTTEIEIDPNTIYYTENGDVVIDPIVDDISSYYVVDYVGGVEPGKSYYIQTGDEGEYVYTLVQNPIAEDLPTYYELIDPPQIDPDVVYYTRSLDEYGDEIYTEVASPIISEIEDYYTKVYKTDYVLDRLPLSLSIDGAGEGSSTSIIIERLNSYEMARPDESIDYGFEGETICLLNYTTDGDFIIDQNNLIGYLDDGASYRLIATSKDAYNQAAEASIEFTVRWAHQAIMPVGQVTIDNQYDVAYLTPLLPLGASPAPGDVCDIYRLSIDKPSLVYSGAIFGETYVDPYPTIGSRGGYRFVYRTFNGDYTTEDNTIAWYNTPEHTNPIIKRFSVIINFGNDSISLPYNVSLNNKWAKDFQQTAYLGGSIQGDWNPGVKRSGSISTVGIVNTDVGSFDDIIVTEQIRRLAAYSGLCHVRTPDGSNFAANINVTEDREEKMINQLAKYSLEIMAVDSQGLDGMTYDEWVKRIGG